MACYIKKIHQRRFISRTRDFEMNTITRNCILQCCFRSGLTVSVLRFVKITRRESTKLETLILGYVITSIY